MELKCVEMSDIEICYVILFRFVVIIDIKQQQKMYKNKSLYEIFI
jgi:hypothetical protein